MIYADCMNTPEQLRKKYASLQQFSDDELVAFDESMRAFARLLVDWWLEEQARSKNAPSGSLMERDEVR